MKNNCKSVQEQLALYQAGMLTAEASADVTAHLADCEACTAAAARELAIGATLHDLFQDGTSGSVAGSVAAALDREKGSGWRHPVLRVVVGVAAALVVTVLIHYRPGGPAQQIRTPLIRMARMVEWTVRAPEFREQTGETSIRKLKDNVVWVTMVN